jgi:superfamily II DNA or RNA helicase
MNDAHRENPQDDSDFTALPPGRWRSLLDDLASFLSNIRARGMEYAAMGRVGPLAVSELGFAAPVRGRVEYRTSWHWDDGDNMWRPECTCPSSPYCKHAYALACCALDRARAVAGFFDQRLARLVPPTVPRPLAAATAIPAATSGAQPPRDRPRPASAPPAQRVRADDDTGWGADASLESTAPATVRELLKTVTSWGREAILIRMLGPHARKLQLHLPPFDAIFDESDAELMCWRLAQEIPHRTGGWLPPALEPYRRRDELAERYAARELPLVERELLRWAGERTGTPQRSIRLVLDIAPAENSEITVTTEVRMTSPRMHDVPRTTHQLTQLQSELRRKPGLLPPEQALLLHAVIETQVSGWQEGGSMNSGLARMLRRVGDSPWVTWSDDLPDDLARRAGVKAGGPVRLSDALVRLIPACIETGGEPRLTLQVYWPDGRRRPLDEIFYFRAHENYSESQPGLVLCDGVFHELIEEPPPALVDRFQYAGSIPVRPEVRGAILAQLAEAFPGMRESLAGHTRHLDVVAAVLLDLRENDWLQIRVMAHAPGDGWRPGREAPVLFEYTPERRWEAVTPAAPAAKAASRRDPDVLEPIAGAERPSDVPGTNEPVTTRLEPPREQIWFEAPNSEQVAPALEWLRATGARAGEGKREGGGAHAPADADVGWWIKLNPRNATTLADAWERRPRDLEWFGSRSMQRLLGSGSLVRSRLRVKSSGIDWLVVSAEWEAEGMALTEDDLDKLRGATTQWVKLASGWIRREVVETHDQAAAMLADLGIELGGGEQRVTRWQLAAARPDSLAALERLGADPDSARTVERMREQIADFRGLPAVPVPAGFAGTLRPYQQQGLDFLAWTGSLGLGVVLADDMGLGKTIQALAWVQHLREQDPERPPCLVVCPTSVLHNWVRESARFTPGLRVLMLASGSERRNLHREVSSHDLIVTSYALLRRDLEAWKQTALDAVILDEAQNIKNPDTAIARAVRELAAPHRLALTGTPLENRALDLWSIMGFINPGYLGARARFSALYDRLDAPPHARALLAARLRPVMLRRLKREVAADLPDRIEERRDCELTPGQRQLYTAELLRARAQVAALAHDPADLQKNRFSILAQLTRLRQICCHPALVGGDLALGSGKFEALFELLEPLLAEGHKVLVFSQFVRCLDMLAAEMSGRGIPFHVLTGATTHRDQVVDAFVGDPRAAVFLVSLKAGGTGLNLTAASYVVLFDPWWNPAVEAQAIDRTHRIGQDRTVIAYRMLATGTIEERIWELQQRKASLIKDVLAEDGFARALNREDLAYLLDEA